MPQTLAVFCAIVRRCPTVALYPPSRITIQMCGVEHRLSMVSKLPRDALLDHLIGLGGMPAELRHQAQLVDYFLPAIRSDYT